MGKKQHSKDRMFITAQEWKNHGGGFKEAKKHAYRALPFSHCALSLQPFTTPMCTLDGTTYDILQIVPYMKKHKKDPRTGDALDARNLVRLHFHKNADGVYHCPVLFKVFNEHTHIVAVRTTGNVYSMEAVEKLNIAQKNWKDLLTDEPFTRKDIITIQDPKNPETRDISQFHCYKEKLTAGGSKSILSDKGETTASSALRRPTTMAESTLKALEETEKERLAGVAKDRAAAQVIEEAARALESDQSAVHSLNKMSASFTSTAVDVVTVNERAKVSKEAVLFEHVRKHRKKGYVRLVTSKGNINLELRCDIAPRACFNFLSHCTSGYYAKTVFHRLVPGFIVQGGDPTGTGKGGESVWGKPFADEIVTHVLHSARGVLSMANPGEKNKNGSQFFVTLGASPHLDGHHTVFGSVVGGLETLTAMEKVETGEKDRPLEDIVLKETVVFSNPFSTEEIEKDNAETRRRADEAAEKQRQSDASEAAKRKYGSGVDQYFAPQVKRKLESNASASAAAKPTPSDDQRQVKKSRYGNFDAF